ncbi:MAG: hypothetical protein WCV92_04635 [Candidatus Buchananbacteria bacterium]
MKIVAMFPSFKGDRATTPDFLTEIKGALPGHDTEVVPILNGFQTEEGACDAERLATELGFQPIVTSPRFDCLSGLAAALRQGYEYASRNDAEVVVRLDTAEHPVNQIAGLVQAAIEIQGLAIGDLDFTGCPDLLDPESPEGFAHDHAFKELYRQTTKRQLCLSCAHGFQVIWRPSISKMLTEVDEIFNQVALDLMATVQTEEIGWGFDGAWALSALAAKVPTTVVQVPAINKRDRPSAKVGKQLANALRVCRAAAHVYHW